MNRHRKIIFSAGLLAAIVSATPVTAQASPLLSGYGGPGQGSQMILGSSVLNGPGSGGGGGGQAAAASEASTVATNPGRVNSPAGSASSSSVVVHAGHGVVLRQRSSSRGAPAGTSGSAPGTYPSTSPALARQAAPPALGVSENDLLYILLALGLLAFAGVLTRRFTYPRSGPPRGAQ